MGMRMVFSKAQVAEALGLNEAEFDLKRAELERLGFPQPITGLVETWSIIHVSLWVNRDDPSEEVRQEDVAKDNSIARHLQ
jgi:hypothetical protein